MPRPSDEALLCPSAQPEMADAQILGVISTGTNQPRVTYLNEPVAATPELLAQAVPAAPGEIFRLAGALRNVEMHAFRWPSVPACDANRGDAAGGCREPAALHHTTYLPMVSPGRTRSVRTLSADRHAKRPSRRALEACRGNADHAVGARLSGRTYAISCRRCS